MQPQSRVKQALLPSLTQLCLFLGQAQATELLLPHLMTFLNGPSDDWLLRESLFHNLMGLCTIVGPRNVEDLLLPLISQGINGP